MSSSDLCVRVRQRVSRWVDGCLDADTSAIVERHLEMCGACRAEFAAMRELSRRVAEQPVDELPAGFAARVREVALAGEQSAPRRFGHPVALRLAAAAFVIIGLVWAYDLGREHGRADDVTQLPSGQSPNGQAPTAHAVVHDSPTHLRAARSVASDLGVIDRIPEAMRRPMLRAQIDHFELDRWASEVRRQTETSETVRDLADLISGLDDVLDDESRFGVEIERLRRQALRPSIWLSTDQEAFVTIEVKDAPDRRNRRSRTVRLAAEHMSPVERSGLDRLLEFKEHLADGNPWPFITLGTDDVDLPMDLRPSVEVMIARSLGAAGLDEMAVQWMRPLRQGSPDVFELLNTTIFDGRDPLQFDIEIGGADLEQRLQSLFDKTKGSGEIVIQESAENGGYSFQVFIRTEKNGKKK